MAFLRKKGKNYYTVFKYRGQRYEISCRTSQRAVAESVRREIETQVASKTFKIKDLRQGKTKALFDYVEEYLTYSQSSKARKTYELDKMSLERLKKGIGNVPVDAITTQQLDKFKSELSKTYSVTSVNMIVRSLRAAFQKAIVWRYIQENPMRSVEYIRVPEEEGPFLTTEDVDRLRSVTTPGLYRDFIETALYTGMRVGEICNLKWDDIDFIQMKLRVRNTETFTTKSKKERTIPLHPKLSEILVSRGQTDHVPYVFVRPDGKLVYPGTANKKFRKYCKKAGLDERFHFHTLRHTFASHLAMKGVSLYFIQKILGHQSIQTTTRIYAHLQPEPLAQAIKVLEY